MMAFSVNKPMYVWAFALLLQPFGDSAAQAATLIAIDEEPLATIDSDNTSCSDLLSSLCSISKKITGASQATPHRMEFQLLNQGLLTFAERIENGTSQAWTGYHLTFESIDLGTFAHGGFGDLLDAGFPQGTLTRHSDFAFSLDYVFDTPIATGDFFFPLIDVVLESTTAYQIKVSQYATFETLPGVPLSGTFGLLSLGLAGLGIAGRRNRRQRATRV